MNVKELLNYASKKLDENNIEASRLESEILLSHILEITRSKLLVIKDEEVDKSKEKIYKQYIGQRVKGQPLQYIIKKKELYGLTFKVNESVLIPRNDTEVCIEEAIKILGNSNKKNVLELCTGSGCIAICLAFNTKSEITAIDISSEAIEIAKENARLNNVNQKIKFVQNDMFEGLEGTKKYDMIISNPPYIETNVIDKLEEQVKHEPKIALDGGADGLDFYRIIALEAKKYLKENGSLVLEIGYDQKDKVISLLKEHKEYIDIKCIKDINKNDRVIICRFQKI